MKMSTAPTITIIPAAPGTYYLERYEYAPDEPFDPARARAYSVTWLVAWCVVVEEGNAYNALDCATTYPVKPGLGRHSRRRDDWYVQLPDSTVMGWDGKEETHHDNLEAWVEAMREQDRHFWELRKGEAEDE
jgi:hypothetical protein